jgi:Lon-like ATP-dependent protease
VSELNTGSELSAETAPNTEELNAAELLPEFSDISNTTLSSVAPFPLAGMQKRALSAIKRLNLASASCPVLLLCGFPGLNYEHLTRDLIALTDPTFNHSMDLCYAENVQQPHKPLCLPLRAGTGPEFCAGIAELYKLLRLKLDAETLVAKILRKQNQSAVIAKYLSDLSSFIAQDGLFESQSPLNLMLHHAQPEQPPVIFARDLTWRSLFGSVNYVTEQGSIYSNHHLLEPGLVRQANGGYLIIQTDELLAKPALWFKLQNALAKGSLDWATDDDATPPVPFFQPEATPLDLKLILVGDFVSIGDFNLLDSEFAEQVFLRTDLLDEVAVTPDSQLQLIGLLSHIRHRWDLVDFDAGAILELLRFACRLCEHQRLFSFDEPALTGIMQLSSSIALEQQQSIVTKTQVKAALAEQEYRLSSIVEQSNQSIIDRQILLQTDGAVVGQINGLSVIEIMGHPYDFGEPVRLTATVHMGDGDIADIERKAELAGHIHAKAMMIIHGYLSTLFGAESPSPLSANLVFEQSYSEIDGDSASLTGLCALLSALAQQPIFQHLAVTGAVDQFGNVQPVGGLNEKIEGFFRICQLQGLTGKQGVIIPASNRLQLILSDAVVEAVQAGQFHIYPVKHAAEAVELLMDCQAGTIDDPNTLFGVIKERLDELNGAPRRRGILSLILRKLLILCRIV